MSHVTILAGPPGSGKTHYREEYLPQMPGIDMADIYQEHDEKYPGFSVPWDVLHRRMHTKLIQLLRKEGDVWVEGIFKMDSPSLSLLMTTLNIEGADWTVVRMDTPLEECFARVAEDFEAGRVPAQKTRKRNEILRSMAKEANSV